MKDRLDLAVVGGGIVGLATALAFTRSHPGASVEVFEKESQVALHQSGRNSGVIHSGIYYEFGSLKARFARAGAQATVDFCREYDLPHEICGKVIVATDESELPRMDSLLERARSNGVEVRRLSGDDLRAREPHVRGIAGIEVPSAGITDFASIARRIAELVVAAGGRVRTGAEVLALEPDDPGVRIATATESVRARVVVNCGGLFSDRIARRMGVDPGVRIVPFRGEYFELTPARRDLVRGLIYPVPDPRLPFLGVHLTRTIHGGVHAGPNAVLALRREGYRKTDFSWRDSADVLGYPGLWRLALRYPREALGEVWRSLSRRSFARSLQRLVPGIGVGDLVPTASGVRAQALSRDGSLVHDFLLVPCGRVLHVCNAPSPAATAALPIGDHVAAMASRLAAGKEVVRT